MTLNLCNDNENMVKLNHLNLITLFIAIKATAPMKFINYFKRYTSSEKCIYFHNNFCKDILPFMDFL